MRPQVGVSSEVRARVPRSYLNFDQRNNNMNADKILSNLSMQKTFHHVSMKHGIEYRASAG